MQPTLDARVLNERLRHRGRLEAPSKADSGIRFVDEVIRRLPSRVPVIQTDNGAGFQSHFHWHLEEHDIRHVYIRPGTPLER